MALTQKRTTTKMPKVEEAKSNRTEEVAQVLSKSYLAKNKSQHRLRFLYSVGRAYVYCLAQNTLDYCVAWVVHMLRRRRRLVLCYV